MSPPRRVYLDQRIKFWLAFVGALTLLYLFLVDNRLLFPRNANPLIFVIHAEHPSLDHQALLPYARANKYDVIVLENSRDWGRELSGLLAGKSDGTVLLLVNSELNFHALPRITSAHPPALRMDRDWDLIALAYSLRGGDFQVLANQCGGMQESLSSNAQQQQQHPFLVCESRVHLYYDKRGKQLVLEEKGL